MADVNLDGIQQSIAGIPGRIFLKVILILIEFLLCNSVNYVVTLKYPQRQNNTTSLTNGESTLTLLVIFEYDFQIFSVTTTRAI